MTLAQLRAALGELKAEGTALCDLAETEGRELTAAEEARFAEIETKLPDLQAKVTAAETLAQRRRTMGALPHPAGYNTVNDLNPATTGGFADIGEFANAVFGASAGDGTFDTRLAADPSNVHQGGAQTGEGFLLPTSYRDKVFEVVSETDEFGPLIDEEPTSSRRIEGLADEATPWGGSGIKAFWRKEATKMDASKMDLDGRSTTLEQLYAFVIATDELMTDAPRLASRMTIGAGRAIAWKKNAAIVAGTGAGQPLGWMNSKAMIVVAKEAGQAADTITAMNIVQMYSRLIMMPGSSPFWLANQEILTQLMFLTIGEKPIWTPPNGFADAPGGFLLGLPIRWSQHGRALGDKGDLQLIQPKGYYGARHTSGIQHASSIHLFFDRGLEAFRWTFRYGGQPHLSKPIEPAHGGLTKSHFVTLEARA